jgi:eukaryotic-like serine/threonine-protein kinase
MTPERFRLISELYDAAATLDPGERTRFIDKRCANDDELRRELMDAFRETGSALAGVVEMAAAAVVDGRDHGLGRRLGKYHILRVLGEGGMGVVYEAEQDHPRRIVALKVIKAGVASPELLHRFEQESQILARLQHPGIAQIYEAGAAETDLGPQPYFAMEFIHGVPLREYVVAQKLDLGRRLELMAKVCDAVEHAHQRGVIHRDLKPANILVDQDGQPKILDFGVARATDSDARATRQTNIGQLVGTLAYMSPEQVTADPLDLDTRSDVYALGVILYELLAARLPYTISNNLHEAARAIREQDPERLSSVSRSYRGDIETIAGKALEKDKARRYASASALAEDLRRYLADEPVAARAASTTYQLQKFVRRHRALVGGVAAVLVVLAAGVVVSTWQAVRARQAERAAVEAQQTAQAVNDFLQNDLLAQASASTQAGPSQRPDPDLKVRTALDRAAARISGKFGPQPGVEAAIRGTIGETYQDLGLYPEARTQLEQALQLYERRLGAENATTAKIISRLGNVAVSQGKYAEAEALAERAWSVQRRVLPPEHPDTLYSMNTLGNAYYLEGKYDRAEPLHRQVLEIRRRVLGPEHPRTLSSMNNLAGVYYSQSGYAKAEGLWSQTLEIRRRVLGSEHPDTLSSMRNLALDYEMQRKTAQAETLMSEALEIYRRVLGPEHSSTVGTMSNLARIYEDEGSFTKAEMLYRQALEIQRRVLTLKHDDTLFTMLSLGSIDLSLGRYEEGEALARQASENIRRFLGPEHPYALVSLHVLANAFAAQRRYAQSEALYGEALGISRRVLGDEHADTLSTLSDYAGLYQQWGKYAQAEKLAAEALSGRRKVLGPDSADTILSAADLALAYQSQGKWVDSERLAREALEFYRKNRPDDWPRFRIESLLGASLSGQKRYAEAEPLLLEGYQGMVVRKARIGAPDWHHVDRSREWIIRLYQSWEKPDRAAEWRSR